MMAVTRVTTMHKPTGLMRVLAIGAVVALVGGCGVLPAPEAAVYADMASTDITMATQIMQDTLTNGKRGDIARWDNPGSGNSGAFEVGRTLVDRNGAFCRDYIEVVRLADGRSARMNNRACITEEGIWRWI